jgi:hypothetical protein
MITSHTEKKLVQGNLPFNLRDDFMFFTWNGASSYVYNCFIENKNDLVFAPHPSFSDNFDSPMYQNTRYFLGTSIEGKEFSLNLCFCNITLAEFRKAISNWLQINAISLLNFDYDQWYGYNCKLKSVGDAKKYISGTNDNGDYLYVLELTISFETVEYAYAVCPQNTIDLFSFSYDTSNNFSVSSGSLTNNNFNKNSEDEVVGYAGVINSISSIMNDFSLSKITNSSLNSINISGTELLDTLVLFKINNLGDLDTQFDLTVHGIANGEVKVFLLNTSDKLTISENAISSSFPSSILTYDNLIAWWRVNEKLNQSTEGSIQKFPVKYSSDTGLLSIYNQPANMTVIENLTALDYNKCKANISLTPGDNFLFVQLIENDKSKNNSGYFELNFRKRTTVI